LQFCLRTFCSEFIAMVYSLLGFFFGMIAVFAAAVGTMIGLTNFSTGAGHYPHSLVERNVTAINSEPRLYMSVPETKDGSPAKNVEANSAAVPDEKADAKKSEPHKPKLLARQRNNGNAMHYAQETRNGPRGLFFNW
jgi:hypothetical protein